MIFHILMYMSHSWAVICELTSKPWVQTISYLCQRTLWKLITSIRYQFEQVLVNFTTMSHYQFSDCVPSSDKCPGGGGVLPIWWVIHMCRGFDPLFWPSGYQTLSFWGVFFSSTNTKTIFWVQILTKFDLFGPKIPFSSPQSFWVQFSVAHGTPPAIFGPSTPPGDKCNVHFDEQSCGVASIS